MAHDKPEKLDDVPQQGLVRSGGELPTPIFSGQQMALALEKYRELQNSLDGSMPEQIIKIQGKPFRKKGYWRAVNLAFGLSCEPIHEERIEAGFFADGNANFGYNVTYRATAPNGRSATGDGSCMAIEKAPKFKCPHPERPGSSRVLHWKPEDCPAFDPASKWARLPDQASEHNVRSHAHTRAFNRAVSNLVGFGEVSAEEVDRSAPDDNTIPGEVVARNGQPTRQAPRQEAQASARGPQAPPPQRAPQRPTAPRTDPSGQGSHGEYPPEYGYDAPPPDEMENELPGPEQTRQGQQRARQQQAPPPRQEQGPVISEAQDKRYFARAMKAGWDKDDLRSALERTWGMKRSDEIPQRLYNRIIAWVDRGPEAAAAAAGQ